MASTGLLDLPYDVMVYLCKYLTSTSKYHLSKTCRHFESVMMTPSIWDKVKVKSISPKEIKYFLARISKITWYVWIRSTGLSRQFFTADFFQNVSHYEKLTVLALEGQHFGKFINSDGKLQTINIDSFPDSLQELSLRGSTPHNPKNFFQSTKDRSQLRVLILNECGWLWNKVLEPLATFKNLEILSLMACFAPKRLKLRSVLKECNELKVLDIRLTNVDEAMVCCVNCAMMLRMPSLQALYQERLVNSKHDSNFSLSSILTTLNDLPPPKSYLYVDPYSDPCTCSHRSFGWNQNFPARKGGLKKLAIKNFRNVNLRYLGVIDIDILDLTGSGIIVSDVTSFLMSHPTCRLIHPFFCTCLAKRPDFVHS